MTSNANIKCVVVGDVAVGKTCMLYSYANNSFPDDYVPTVFDNSDMSTVLFENKHVSLGLWDTAGGREDYDRLKSYPDTNVFLIAFSLVDPTSLENVKTKWVPEIREHAPGVPILIAGTKLDLRENSQIMRELQERDEKPVTTAEGEKVARELKVQGYYECSAKTQKGLKNVFESVIRQVLSPSPTGICSNGKCGVCPRCRGRGCSIL